MYTGFHSVLGWYLKRITVNPLRFIFTKQCRNVKKRDTRFKGERLILNPNVGGYAFNQANAAKAS